MDGIDCGAISAENEMYMERFSPKKEDKMEVIHKDERYGTCRLRVLDGIVIVNAGIPPIHIDFRLDVVWDMLRDHLASLECREKDNPGLYRRIKEAKEARKPIDEEYAL